MSLRGDVRAERRNSVRLFRSRSAARSNLLVELRIASQRTLAMTFRLQGRGLPALFDCMTTL